MADHEYWKYFDECGKSGYIFPYFYLMERIY